MSGNIPSDGKKSPVPIPADMAGLPVIEAENWFQVDSSPEAFLEGPSFDKKGNLFATSPQAGIVYKITPDKKLSVVYHDDKVRVDGSAFDKNGRLFFACISGELMVLDTESGDVTMLYPKYEGKGLAMNDLVFDDKGNVYVTDFSGTIMDPTGGVYRLSPDASVVEPVLQGMASPNGISLSPDNRILWVGETTRNTVIRITLQEDGVTPVPIDGVTCVYYSTGYVGPDSNKVDADGNLYQAIMGQGRILVLNQNGLPVANVVVPGRDEGKSLRSTNLVFKPGTDEGYITTSGEDGAWVCKFKALTKGLTLYADR